MYCSKKRIYVPQIQGKNFMKNQLKELPRFFKLTCFLNNLSCKEREERVIENFGFYKARGIYHILSYYPFKFYSLIFFLLKER